MFKSNEDQNSKRSTLAQRHRAPQGKLYGMRHLAPTNLHSMRRFLPSILAERVAAREEASKKVHVECHGKLMALYVNSSR